jgi:hypothetical protein
MANTKKVPDRKLRKSLKRAQRRRLKAIDSGLSLAQRVKLRRARKEKHVGIRAWLTAQQKAAEASA